jgi:hypothetical protein
MAADPLKRRGEAGMSIFLWSFPMDFWEDATAPVAHLGRKLSFAPQAAGSARHIVPLTGVILATLTGSFSRRGGNVTTCCVKSAVRARVGEDVTETLDLIPRQWQVGPARPREVLLPGPAKRSTKWPVPTWNFHVPFERLRRADDARPHRGYRRDRRHAHGDRRPPRRRHHASRQLHGGKLRRYGGWPRGRFAHPGGADGTAAAVDAPGPIALGGRTREATEVGANGN